MPSQIKKESVAKRISLFNLNTESPLKLKLPTFRDVPEERFEDSLAIMIHGIRATKYHYSRQAHENCLLKITPDLRFIEWSYNHGTIFRPNGAEKVGRCKFTLVYK